jgi:two-component system alkaline phosphatase synthesis response regulator PhoP
MKPRVLIVDDEDTIRYFLKLELEQQNYEVWDVATGEKALELLKTHNFDVALLDLRLPGISGQKVMHYLRQLAPHTSIIIITAYATLDSAIDALKHGAHDYLVKPFDTEEVLASVADGIARQGRQIPTVEHEDPILMTGPLKLDLNSHQVYLNDDPLKLTPTEFDLLVCFMKAPNTALDSVTLLEIIRGYQLTEAEARSIVRVHIHRLRQKLEINPTQPTLITTVQGGRYLLAAP